MKHKSDNNSMEFQNSCQLTFYIFCWYTKYEKGYFGKETKFVKIWGGGNQTSFIYNDVTSIRLSWVDWWQEIKLPDI